MSAAGHAQSSPGHRGRRAIRGSALPRRQSAGHAQSRPGHTGHNATMSIPAPRAGHVPWARGHAHARVPGWTCPWCRAGPRPGPGLDMSQAPRACPRRSGRKACHWEPARRRTIRRRARLRMACMNKPSMKPSKRSRGATALAAVAGVAAAAVVLSVAELIGAFFTARATPADCAGLDVHRLHAAVDEGLRHCHVRHQRQGRAVRRHGGHDPAARVRARHRGVPEVGPGRGRRGADGRRDRRPAW